MQSAGRVLIARSQFIAACGSIVSLQAWSRKNIGKAKYQALVKCIIKLQIFAQRVLRKARKRRFHRGVVRLQCAWRGRAGRRFAQERVAHLHRRKLAIRALLRIRCRNELARQQRQADQERRDQVLTDYKKGQGTKPSLFLRRALDESAMDIMRTELEETKRERDELRSQKAELEQAMRELELLRSTMSLPSRSLAPSPVRQSHPTRSLNASMTSSQLMTAPSTCTVYCVVTQRGHDRPAVEKWKRYSDFWRLRQRLGADAQVQAAFPPKLNLKGLDARQALIEAWLQDVVRQAQSRNDLWLVLISFLGLLPDM